MDQHNDILKVYNSYYRSSNFAYVGQFVDPKHLTLGFKEGESFTLNPTNELDRNYGRLSANGVEDEVVSSADHAVDFSPIDNRNQTAPYETSNQFQQICGNKHGTPYTYDKFGQLEGNAGYGKEVIEHYLCKHHFYGESNKLKDCGLTL